MKRAVCLLIAATILCGSPGSDCEGVERPSESSSRPIALEVMLVRTAWGPNDERANSLAGDSNEVAKRLRELESSGELLDMERIAIMTMEHQAIKLQMGKNVPVATGRSINPRGGEMARSYQYQNVGTHISASASGSGSAIVAKVEVEVSQLERRAKSPEGKEDEAALVPLGTETFSAHADVRIESGQTVLATVLQGRSDAVSSSQFILISARFIESSVQPPDNNAHAAVETPELHIFQLQHATAKDSAKLIQAMDLGDSPPCKAVADERTNSLVVMARPSQFQQIEPLLRRLDEKESVRTGDTPQETKQTDRLSEAAEYGAMSDQDLVEAIKVLQAQSTEANRAAQEAQQRYRLAYQAYNAAPDEQKSDSLLRMLEAEAAKHTPMRQQSEVHGKFESAQRAYVTRMRSRQP